MASKIERERKERRSTIISGVSQGLKKSDIAAKLGVERWVVDRDLRMMRREGNPDLRHARKAREEQAETKKQSTVSSERFMRMTGMTFKEKSFRNMVDFYRSELMNVLKSDNQYNAILDLPKSVQRTLKKNGIIIHWRRNRRISPKAMEYLLRDD